MAHLFSKRKLWWIPLKFLPNRSVCFSKENCGYLYLYISFWWSLFLRSFSHFLHCKRRHSSCDMTQVRSSWDTCRQDLTGTVSPCRLHQLHNWTEQLKVLGYDSEMILIWWEHQHLQGQAGLVATEYKATVLDLLHGTAAASIADAPLPRQLTFCPRLESAWKKRERTWEMFWKCNICDQQKPPQFGFRPWPTPAQHVRCQHLRKQERQQSDHHKQPQGVKSGAGIVSCADRIMYRTNLSIQNNRRKSVWIFTCKEQTQMGVVQSATNHRFCRNSITRKVQYSEYSWGSSRKRGSLIFCQSLFGLQEFDAWPQRLRKCMSTHSFAARGSFKQCVQSVFFH